MASSRKSKSSDLAGRVAAVLAPHVPAGSSILIGLSGGVDSVVLLHLLQQISPQYSWRLSALHVHHGISSHADEWAEFCAGLCAHHSIPIQIECVNIQPIREMGVEAAARQLRHDVLSGQEVDFIALAHHQDDQAETILLQLLRGAGVKGAAAMPALRTRSGSPALLRPLLDISRAELLAYAQQHRLHWVDDESNFDVTYPRNFLRHRVLPLLEERFPAARATLARSARHFAEAAELMDMLAEQDAHGAFDDGTLDVAALTRLDTIRAKNLLCWFIQQRGALLPDHTRLEEMLRQLCDARSDAQLCISWKGWELRRHRDRAHVLRSIPEPQEDFCIRWNGEDVMALPQLGGELRFAHVKGMGVSLQKLQSAPVTIRLRQGEERLRPDAARPSRSLKYLFQEHGVPPWQRIYWPLLYCGKVLIGIPDIALDHSFRAGREEEGVEISWIAGEET